LYKAYKSGKNISKQKFNETKVGRNSILIGEKVQKRSVWTVTTKPYKEAHFATYPPDLIEPCILAGCPKGGHVLDPFGGSGTTALVADRLGRNATLIELNKSYVDIINNRLKADNSLFMEIVNDN
jgi:DNA modification methylase